MTGTGKCSMGKCAGTSGNPQGNTEHRQQSIAATREKKTETGGKEKGRREITRDTAMNTVAEQLVQEIMRAALRKTADKSKQRLKRKRGI
jgi:hypothetical protein